MAACALSRSLSSASARPSRRSPPMPMPMPSASPSPRHPSKAGQAALVRCCGEARACHGEFLLLRVRGAEPLLREACVRLGSTASGTDLWGGVAWFAQPGLCCGCGCGRAVQMGKWPAERAKRLGLFLVIAWLCTVGVSAYAAEVLLIGV